MSIMSINRIKYLRESLEDENLDTSETIEINDAFNQLVESGAPLRDEAENALAGDMLDELEELVSPLEWAIYDFVVENFGESEANDPSWDIGALANHLEKEGFGAIQRV